MRRRRSIPTGGFKSQFENAVSEQLKALVPTRKGKTSYETEKLPYTLSKTYIPDFIIELRDGRKIYLEVKGYFSYEDRTKMAAVKKQHPELDIRLVFKVDNKISKRTSMTYTTWATNHGFLSCVGEVPKEWMQT